MKFKTNKSLKAALIAGASMLALSSGQATAGVLTIETSGCFDENVSCSLAELDEGGTIKVGDKLFDNWSLGLNFPSPGAASVTGISSSGNYGLLFSGIEFSVTQVGSGENSDTAEMFYKVSVVDAPMEIISNTLTLLESLAQGIEGGSAEAKVEEFVSSTSEFAGDIGTKTVLDSNSNASDIMTDMLPISPARSFLWVKTELNIEAMGVVAGSADADLSSFSTTYGQRAIPEPGTAALLGAGLAGLAGLRRRKKRV